MKHRIREAVEAQHSTTCASTATTSQADVALRRVVADEIGPRKPGTVYDNAAGVFEVRQAVTEPLDAFTTKLIDHLELRLNAPEVLPAAARYELAARRTAEISRWLDSYDVTDMHMDDLEFAQDVMRESRSVLAAAGRLDLIGGA